MKTATISKLLSKELLGEFHSGSDVNTILPAWEKCFKIILRKRFAFNKKAAQAMFDWGDDGFNWKLLHADPETTEQEYLVRFFGEIGYINDRMSIDRLLRTHHLIRCAWNLNRFAGVKKQAFMQKISKEHLVAFDSAGHGVDSVVDTVSLAVYPIDNLEDFPKLELGDIVEAKKTPSPDDEYGLNCSVMLVVGKQAPVSHDIFK